MSTAISISGLEKRFGPTRALDGLDLEVRTGEVHGFLGPNGAGKTTTIRVLLGLLRADGGRADLLERFDLDPRKKARTYSKGNRQKVALIAALASDVELLLLDEPTAGLDPLMEATFRQVITEENHGGRTVLLSSHILAEVEALADRVSIIRAGRIVESGTLAELRHLTRTSITAELAVPPDGLLELPGVHDLEIDGTRVRLQVDPASLDGVLRQLTSVGVRSLTSQPPTLEELFLRHYQAEEAATADGNGERRTEETRR
ncbi:MAG TPA: ABC transporter ATP-binding protein [Actinomycetes bacterium]|nr:ABC transporter ATP-binding protein [Actinomycetes bacterium]